MSAAKIVELKKGERIPGELGDAIVIGQGLDPAEVIALAHVNRVRHLVQRDGLDFEAELAFAERAARDPSRFLQHPCEMIFGPAPAGGRASFLFTCDADDKKSELLSAFGGFAAKVQGSRAIWDRALLVADELYTNASKNAWDPGTKLFTGPATRKGQIEFFAQADLKRIVIGCRDSFGLLETSGLVERIWSCYEKGIAKSIRFGPAGAGIGSFMVYDACTSYYAGAEQGKATVVCVALPLGVKRREIAGLSKSLHVIA